MDENHNENIDKIIEKDGIKYSLDPKEKTAKIVGSNWLTGNIIIPRSIQHESTEYIITSISKKAFNCTHIDWLSFSNDSELQVIEEYAFSNGYIQRFTIPPSLRKICKNAFYSCKNLKIIETPPNSELRTIEKSSFSFSSIESFTIPASLTDLQKGWCDFTPKLIKINISSDNPRYKLYDEGKIIIGKSSIESQNYDNLVFCVRNANISTIPSFIEHICDNAFEHCDQLKIFKFPSDSKLLTIGRNAFSYSSIEKMTISCHLTKIGLFAFSECKKLQSIEIPMDSELQTIEQRAFTYSSIERFTISPHLTKICKYAFFRCNQLKTIEFLNESELKFIGESAFCDTIIDNFTIPASVVDLEEGWFYYTPKLKVINVSPDNSFYKKYENKLILGKSLAESDVYDIVIFCDRNTKSIEIPSQIKYIGSYSFDSCSCLKKVGFQSDSKLQTIGKYAFESSEIECFTIPCHLTRIRESAFSNCEKLTKFHIPENSEILFIEKNAFTNSSITSLAIPSTVQIFDLQAISRCSFLQIVEIQSASIENANMNRYHPIVNRKIIIMSPNRIPLREMDFDDFLI